MIIFDQLTRRDPHLRMITLIVLAGVAILVSGLWYVQVISYRDYAEDQKNQAYRTVRIPAVRGKILDRNNQPLAENRPNYQVSLYLDELRESFSAEWKQSQPPRQVNRYSFEPFGIKLYEWKRVEAARKLSSEERRALVRDVRWRVVSNLVCQLSNQLRHPISIEAEQFFRHYTNQLALPLPLIQNLELSQIARFQEVPRNFPGVDLDIQPTRFYPGGSTAAHLVGYLKRDDSSVKDEDAFFNFRLPDYRGLVGIEGVFDSDLRGKAGVKSVLVNNMGYRQTETIWNAAEPGSNVVLTIDLRIQQAAEQALQSVNSKYHPVRGAVVVMDPNNGDLLAMVSSPTFDPNTFLPRITVADWQRLSDEETKPQRNRASQENYHPGSIFKIVVALAALEAGLDPQEKYEVPPAPWNPTRGYIQVGRKTFRDTAEPGEYDFYRAFIKSSNTYFITNGLRYGVENVVRIGRHLHLGEPVGLPTFQDNGGQFPTLPRVRANWSSGDTANLSIGQGEIDVTPIQMAVLISSIANGGQVFWPRLVSRIEPQDPAAGEARHWPRGRVRDRLPVSPKTLQTIRHAMHGDVQDTEGTGKGARIPGFEVCAKTGTAQVIDINGKFVDYITWFASYGPYEQPRYVVVVMVEGGSSGGGTCAPVARKIYETMLRLEAQRAPQITSAARPTA